MFVCVCVCVCVFHSNNSLFSESNLVNNSDLATAPSTIEIDVDVSPLTPSHPHTLTPSHPP